MGITPWEEVDGQRVLKIIENYARKCYQTEAAACEGSAIPFMQKRIRDGHIAIMDHLHITADFITDRGVSHEWLRHKLCEILNVPFIDEPDWTPWAVCQESTRYCNYMKSGGVMFIIPPWVDIPEGNYSPLNTAEDGQALPNFKTTADRVWFFGKAESEYRYLKLLELGWTPQQARGDLVIAVKTNFSVTCSLTEWRHVMRQRTHKSAHPQMYEIMRPLLKEFQEKLPVLFDDICY
jgi:thymidylate synthase (FAD)